MDPKPTNEDHEARAGDPNMAGSDGASGEDVSSASPASTDGARPGQLGAVGYFGQLAALERWVAEPTPELPRVPSFREDAAEVCFGVRFVEGPTVLRGPSAEWRESPKKPQPPLRERLKRTRARADRIARRTVVRANAGAVLRGSYASTVSASEISAGYAEGVRDRDGKVLRDPLEEREKLVFDLHLSRPLARTFFVIDGLMRGERSCFVDRLAERQDHLRAGVFDHEIVKAVQQDFLAPEYQRHWHEDRGPTGNPRGRPKTAISDPREMVDRFLILLRGALEVVGNNADPELVKLLLRIGDAVARPQEDLGVVAEILKPKGKGRGKRTLEKERSELRELAGKLALGHKAFDGSAFLTALARAPELVTFVSRLRVNPHW
jgi:hypothetical protein